jgi:hypothetical protein
MLLRFCNVSRRDLIALKGLHRKCAERLVLPVRYDIDKEHRVVVTTAWDRVTFAEAKAHQDQLRSDPDFRPEFNQLIDATAVTKADFSIEEIRILASGMGFFSAESRRVLVASRPSIFGVGRLLSSYGEIMAGQQSLNILYDLNSALEWLGLETLPVSIKHEVRESK